MTILKWISIIFVLIVLLAGGFIVYRNATSPYTVNKAKQMTQNTYHYDYHPFLGGCARFPEIKKDDK